VHFQWWCINFVYKTITMIATENNVMSKTLRRLQYLAEEIPAMLMQIPEEEFSNRPAPEKWSKKEILGHLIDSANNNHQRFVRAQFENEPRISYQQDDWVKHNRYQEMDRELLVNLWSNYNLFIAALAARLPEESLKKTCNSNGTAHSLEWLVIDYLKHLEHHLGQLVTY
jgi:hypothetical protein